VSGKRSPATIAFWAVVILIGGFVLAVMAFCHVVGRTTAEPPGRRSDGNGRVPG
jgi:hypothetical protein